MNSPKYSSLRQVLRSDRRALSKPHVRRPIRLWMTGSLAVVMAALLPTRGFAESLADAERAESQRMLRHSRFGVVETVQRLEDAALAQGLSVLARLQLPKQPVLVLASSVGGTLVMMDELNDRVQIPLSLQVRAGAGEGADVLVPAFALPAHGEWADLPERAVADLALLPAVIDQALG